MGVKLMVMRESWDTALGLWILICITSTRVYVCMYVTHMWHTQQGASDWKNMNLSPLSATSLKKQLGYSSFTPKSNALLWKCGGGGAELHFDGKAPTWRPANTRLHESLWEPDTLNKPNISHRHRQAQTASLPSLCVCACTSACACVCVCPCMLTGSQSQYSHLRLYYWSVACTESELSRLSWAESPLKSTNARLDLALNAQTCG